MRHVSLLVVVAILLAGAATFAQEAIEKPKEQPGQEEKSKVEELIGKLGSADFEEREAATEELKKMGEPAAEALRKATGSEDAEVAWRAREILDAIEKTGGVAKSGEKKARREPGDPGDEMVRRLREALKRDGDKDGKSEGGIIIAPGPMNEEMLEELEEMLKRLEELGKGFDFPDDFYEPFDEDKDGENSPIDEFRKLFEEMRKRAEETRRRWEEGDEKIEPKTEPREDEAGKEGRKPLDGKSGSTVVVKKFRWENGRLVEEKDYKESSNLPGLRLTDTGNVLDALRYHLSLGEKEGVLVAGVEEDSPFANAGLALHDIITKVGDSEVGSVGALMKALGGAAEVKLEIMRRGERQTLEVKLRENK